MIKPAEDKYEQLRTEMVDLQLVPRGIDNEMTLKAFYTVPREVFLTSEMTSRAYEDRPLPTMDGQTISQPYIVALMTQLLELPDDRQCKILEIGAGSGYQAAILAFMGHQVIAVDRLPGLADFAHKNLSCVPYGSRVKVVTADGTLGWPEDAPYNGIIVSAAAPGIPEKLIEQLAPGGKLVIPCGNLFVQQMLQVEKQHDGDIVIHKSIGCRFVPLIGEDGFDEDGND